MLALDLGLLHLLAEDTSSCCSGPETEMEIIVRNIPMWFDLIRDVFTFYSWKNVGENYGNRA